jgi:hypothetical protein
VALKGTLTADFASFYDAVKKAQVSLDGFQADANKVQGSLERMTNSFSGVKIQQQATLVTEAIERIGGASKLTAAEQSRVNAIVSEAIEKYAALGQTAPKALTDLQAATKKTVDETEKLPPALANAGSAASATGGGLGNLTTSLKATDKALGSVGVSIGQQVNALEEINQASGKTVGEIGKIATAGLAVSAALAGWKAGRMIAEFFDLDKKIADTTARLLGFGDVAAETAAAKADVLARATKNAGREITDYSEAIRINVDAVKKHSDSFNTAEQRVRTWSSELSNVRQRGDLRKLEADMAAGNSTLEQMSAQYKISTDAIEYWKRSNADNIRVQKDAADATKKHAAEIAALSDQMLGKGTIKAANDYVAALGPMANLSRMTADETTKLNAALAAAFEQFKLNGDKPTEQMTALYLATLQVPPVINGLGTAIATLGEKVASNKTIYADLDAQAKAAAASAVAWNDAQFAANEAASAAAGSAVAETKQVTAANMELAASYSVVARSADEWRQRAAQAEADSQTNIQRGGIAATYGFFQAQQAASDRQQAGYQAYRENQMAAASAGWSGNRALTVNVNGTSAQDRSDGRTISQRLVDEMKAQGIRF